MILVNSAAKYGRLNILKKILDDSFSELYPQCYQ